MFKKDARHAFDGRGGSRGCGCVTLCVHCVRSRGYSRISLPSVSRTPPTRRWKFGRDKSRNTWSMGARWKKCQKTAKNGNRYAVKMLSCLPTQPLTSVNYLVFDDAFEKLNTQVEGTVFALRKPQYFRRAKRCRRSVRMLPKRATVTRRRPGVF